MKLRAQLLTMALVVFGAVAHAGARQSVGVNVGRSELLAGACERP